MRKNKNKLFSHVDNECAAPWSVCWRHDKSHYFLLHCQSPARLIHHRKKKFWYLYNDFVGEHCSTEMTQPTLVSLISAIFFKLCRGLADMSSPSSSSPIFLGAILVARCDIRKWVGLHVLSSPACALLVIACHMCRVRWWDCANIRRQCGRENRMNNIIILAKYTFQGSLLVLLPNLLVQFNRHPACGVVAYICCYYKPDRCSE